MCIRDRDYGVICDVQIHYHLIHDQIIQYLKKAGNEDSAFIKKLLWISWHMISEAEQMLFLINNRKASAVNSAQMEDYLAFTACILSEIQEMLHMKADRNRTVDVYKRQLLPLHLQCWASCTFLHMRLCWSLTIKIWLFFRATIILFRCLVF